MLLQTQKILFLLLIGFLSFNSYSAAIVVADDEDKNLYFGFYRTSQMTEPGWQLFQSAIDWATPNAQSIVLFTYNGTLIDNGLLETDGIATYEFLVRQGYSVRVKNQREILTGDFTPYDLAIYSTSYGYDATNLLNQGISLISTSVMHTDDMGIGNGKNAFHKRTDTSYVVDTNHPITSPFDFGALTFRQSMWMDGVEASGTSRVLIASEIPIPEPATLWIFMVGLAGLLFTRKRFENGIK